jgi:hypothetical protein
MKLALLMFLSTTAYAESYCSILICDQGECYSNYLLKPIYEAVSENQPIDTNFAFLEHLSENARTMTAIITKKEGCFEFTEPFEPSEDVNNFRRNKYE